MKHKTGSIGCFLATLILWIVAVTGWFMNVYAVYQHIEDPLTTKMILRIAGIVVFPLGVVLGYL